MLLSPLARRDAVPENRTEDHPMPAPLDAAAAALATNVAATSDDDAFYPCSDGRPTQQIEARAQQVDARAEREADRQAAQERVAELEAALLRLRKGPGGDQP